MSPFDLQPTNLILNLTACALNGATRIMSETTRLQFERVAPSEIRYIKLGPNNAWAAHSIDNDRIDFGHGGVPHELAVSGDWDGVRACWGDKISRSKAGDFLREVRAFYTLDSNCLWFTFANGQLWWAFAKPEVILNHSQSDSEGSRYRKVVGAWQSTDRLGRPLLIDNLSSRLTKTAAYRQTICRVAAKDYLLRLINAEDDPKVAAANAKRDEFTKALVPLIQSLHQDDFEILTDLLFSRLGWVRISKLGGTQKDTDLVLEQPATQERALVQVKSSANQAVLDDYTKRFSQIEADKSFFVCHSPKGDLVPHHDITLWSGKELAERVIQAGLTDWLIARSA